MHICKTMNYVMAIKTQTIVNKTYRYGCTATRLKLRVFSLWLTLEDKHAF